MSILASAVALTTCTSEDKPSWPAINNVMKPWTRWWWHGSAVTKEGITKELEDLHRAGFGGVEITPIYGVAGFERQFVQYLSDEWMELFMHTLKEAERLGLGVDMATGTGWPFGGPWVSDKDACKNLYIKVYEFQGGKTIKEKIEFIQQPFLRAVGNQIYEVHDSPRPGDGKLQGTRKEPPLLKHEPVDIKDLVQPVEANPNLQSLALDQVQFGRPLLLQEIVAYGADGQILNISDKVNDTGGLSWDAPTGKWKVYAVFQGWHGKMVERAGPGGEGNVIDHFSTEAVNRYLHRFDSAFRNHDIKSLRAFFNDSYEVDDARGAADWTPALLTEFEKRRKYNLLEHLPDLLTEEHPDAHERVLYDYRITISELLLENFTRPWKQWAHEKGAIVRNQAHGSPANILDLYEEVDIPETEGTDPLRIRMAVSAGNVSGKQLISAESATWLDEHFESGLSDIKANIDNYFINGVNHVLYHGTAYSPKEERWPGWLFYAAVHMNTRNPQWRDVGALNRYIARCQSILQNTKADNDILLYYPAADRLSAPGPEMVEHFDNPVNQFKGHPFFDAADSLLQLGYSFDYISDAQLLKVKSEGDRFVTNGGGSYRVLIIPKSKYIPRETLEAIVDLARAGAKVLLYKGSPQKVVGLKPPQPSASTILEKLGDLMGTSSIRLLWRISHSTLASRVTFERMTELGIGGYRKRKANGNIVYFVNNLRDSLFEGWLPLARQADHVALYDPMTGQLGNGASRSNSDGTEIYVRLTPHQTIIIELSEDSFDVPPFEIYQASGNNRTTGEWQLTFDEGGPELPTTISLDRPKAWTSLGCGGCDAFSGTATYKTTYYNVDLGADDLMLQMDSVFGTATVRVNGDSLATLIGPSYELVIPGRMLDETNVLEISVSNLMSNRIADLDRRGVFWKKFYNVNFPARKAENRVGNLFDASHWKPRPSGISGQVTIRSVVPGSPAF